MNELATPPAASSAVLDDDRSPRLSDGSHAIYLHAGHLYASAEPAQITTILGSSVAVCLWDPIAGIGGMSHYMLPDDVGSNTATLRYANFSILALIEELQCLGALRPRLLARFYGGASMISSDHGARPLGQRNIEIGRARLSEANIPIVEEDVGSTHGRKVVFSTSTGLAVVKRI